MNNSRREKIKCSKVVLDLRYKENNKKYGIPIEDMCMTYRLLNLTNQ